MTTSHDKRILLSSQSQEWYTPSVYIEAARAVMGRIDLDPASSAEANEVVRATTYYTKEQNGLLQSWYGCIWCNPPYGITNGKSNLGIWIHRLISEYRQGTIEQAIILVNACPATRWFHHLFDFPICFTEGRINFYSAKHRIDTAFSRPQGIGNTHGSAFAYLGPSEQRFIEQFSRFGTIVRRISQPKMELLMPELWQTEVEGVA